MAKSRERPGMDSGLRRRARRILVVDDSEETRAVEVCALNDAGYHVMEAADGMTAIEKAANLLPDVIILDFAMPHMDGLAVARHLAKDPLTRGIPVIVATASAQFAPPEIRSLCAAFLVKPFDLDELIATVRALDGARNERAATGTGRDDDT